MKVENGKVVQFRPRSSAQHDTGRQNPSGVTVSRNYLVGPAWETQVKSRFKKLLSLEPDWNGQGAKELSFETVDYAYRMLQYVWPDAPDPFIAPTCYGGVQFEWQASGLELEIEVVGQNQIQVLFLDNVNNEEQTFECTHDLKFLADVIVKFKNRATVSLNEPAAA